MSTTSNGPLEGLRVVELDRRQLAGSPARCWPRAGRRSPASAGDRPARRCATPTSAGAAGCSTGGSRAASAGVDVDLDSAGGQTPTAAGRARRPRHRDRSRRAGWPSSVSTTPTSRPRTRRWCRSSLTPFGRTGPRADWQTSDLVAAALERRAQHLRHARPGHQPVGPSAPHVRVPDGVHLRAGRRPRGPGDGRGRLVDLSLHEVDDVVDREPVLPVVVRRRAAAARARAAPGLAALARRLRRRQRPDRRLQRRADAAAVAAVRVDGRGGRSPRARRSAASGSRSRSPRCRAS